jgi:peptidoglycan hydrolase CwlO-like protein
MARTNNTQKHKNIAVLTAALAMTIFISVAVLAFGVNAILNQNGTTTAQAAGLTSTEATSSQAASDQALIDQLQAQISEYQSREAQFQSELSNAADQINQLNQQTQQYQFLFNELQNAGVIGVTRDGRVFIPNARASSLEGERDGD